MKSIPTHSLFLLLLSGLFLLSSCEEEIDLKLNSADPRVVIEGWITDEAGPYEVLISQTVSYYGEAQPTQISGAQVVISDDLGTVDTLTEIAPGRYETNVLQGRTDGTYSLKAEVNGETYEAMDVLPRINPLDTILILALDSSTTPPAPLGAGFYAFGAAQEIPGIGDNYWFRFYKNDSLYDGPFDYFISDDALVDGQLASFLFPYKLESGDTVTMEVRTISEAAYDFIFSFVQEINTAGGPFGAPPANLEGNISNNAFGYFGAAGQARKTVVVP